MTGAFDNTAGDAHLLQLERILSGRDRIGVAFSGGIDSTFLAAVAGRVYPDRVTAFIGMTCFQAEREMVFARYMAGVMGLDIRLIRVDLLADPRVRENSERRCYYCKKLMFSAFMSAGEKMGITRFVHGENQDDQRRVRPGQQAAAELGFDAPLADAGFTKAMVRARARKMGLENWDRPAQSCLATRIPVHTPIEQNMLDQIEFAEGMLIDRGVAMVRVRVRGDGVRIETDGPGRRIIAEQARDIAAQLRQKGMGKITLDLDDYGAAGPVHGE